MFDWLFTFGLDSLIDEFKDISDDQEVWGENNETEM